MIDFGDGRPPWNVKVIGIAGNVKHFALDDPPTPTVYFPISQLRAPVVSGLISNFNIVVKAPAEPVALAGAARKTLAAIDSEVALSTPATLDDLLSATVAPRKFTAALMQTFAVAGLVLAMIGVYAVLSYIAAQRRHESGIRIALGARPHQVVRLMVARGLKLALIGEAIGIAIEIVVSRSLSELLFDTQPIQPAAYISMASLLLLAVLAASYLPARRAAKTNPIEILR
jgi:predicted lysophospholipase L1 biosynthesis ABC-type transport system permease subunit